MRRWVASGAASRREQGMFGEAEDELAESTTKQRQADRETDRQTDRFIHPSRQTDRPLVIVEPDHGAVLCENLSYMVADVVYAPDGKSLLLSDFRGGTSHSYIWGRTVAQDGSCCPGETYTYIHIYIHTYIHTYGAGP